MLLSYCLLCKLLYQKELICIVVYSILLNIDNDVDKKIKSIYKVKQFDVLSL